MLKYIFQAFLIILLGLLSSLSNLAIFEQWKGFLWFQVLYFIVIAGVALVSVYIVYLEYNDSKKKSDETKALQGQIDKQTEKLSIIEAATLEIRETTKSKYDERIEGKGATFVAESVPAIAEHFSLVFKASCGVITGYVRVKGTKEFFRFSTKVNNKIPVVIHNLWLPEKGNYQSPPTVELVIDSQSDEKAKLSVSTAGFFLPDGM